MHIIARVLAVAYVVLAVFAGAVFSQLVANNVAVTQVQEAYGRPDQTWVRVESVALNWSGDVNDSAWIVVNFSVENPSGVGIEIMGINYDVHMDWPEDPRPWYDYGKLAETYLTSISLSNASGLGVAVPAGATRVVPSRALVLALPEKMSVLDHPDGSGRYHPIVLRPWLVYDFPGLGVEPERVNVPTYYERDGVMPSG